MSEYNNLYCTTQDYLVTGRKFSIFWNKSKTIAKTEINFDESLDKFYISDRYRSHQKKATSTTDLLYHFAKRIMLKYKYGLLEKSFSNFKVLDFGCGIGDFLIYTTSKNIFSVGVENNNLAFNICKSKNLKVYKNIEEVKENQFNAITLWHVLEHIENPAKLVSKIKHKIDKKGALIVALPNIQSFDSQVFKEHWAALDVPRHLWHFTSKGIIKLIEKEGFVFKTKKALLFDAYYISLLSSTNQGLMFPWIISALIGTISNLIGLITGNFSSNIYIFQKGD